MLFQCFFSTETTDDIVLITNVIYSLCIYPYSCGVNSAVVLHLAWGFFIWKLIWNNHTFWHHVTWPSYSDCGLTDYPCSFLPLLNQQASSVVACRDGGWMWASLLLLCCFIWLSLSCFSRLNPTQLTLF